MEQNLTNFAYLISAVLFILGLKGLTSPRTARNGNLLGSMGMLVAVVATLFDHHILTFELILAGIVSGAAIGAIAALKIPITAMPQMVAVFNGFGGAASALVATTAVLAPEMVGAVPPAQLYGASTASAIIGATTFTGSMIAWAKLQEVLKLQPRGIFIQTLNLISIGSAVVLGVYYIYDPSAMAAFWGLLVAASLYGILLTVPIGGADMPVVIALLNSLSGLAAAATGFVLSNSVLIISGTLVGASGFILTSIMCRAMHRSLMDVMAGNLGGPAATGSEADDVYQGRVKSTSPEEAAMLFEDARTVIIVPGYGMAVAQAQRAVRDLADLLQKRGIIVRYAIHPVAGRMPGHMNVLLAEADVPYEQLYEMDRINPLFRETDIAVVIGANDVVNPAARDEPESPIAGMPILEVDKAQTVIVIKRSLRPGFAGISNQLFAATNTLMLYGDGREAVLELIAAMKE